MIVPDYVERSRRKTLSLSVLKDGRVLVKAPLNMKDELINRFVEEKQNWIREKLSSVRETRNKFDDVITYKSFLIYGNRYIPVKSQVKQVCTSEKFELLLPEKMSDEKLMKAVISWYKKLARTVLEDRLHFIESRIGLKSTNLKITDSTGRWGSCNSYGSICFNWRVVMLPTQVIDYVIVHELCHTKEMNHSKNFWTLVQKFLPHYEKLKIDIKEYAFLLNMYK